MNGDAERPTIAEMKEEEFGQPAVAPATSNLPVSLEIDDPEVLAALRFRSEFQKLGDADQTKAFWALKGHLVVCNVHAKSHLGGIDGDNVVRIWKELASEDCGALPNNSPVRSLLIRHGVKVAQNTGGAEINSLLSPAVLSMFGEELAGKIKKIFVRAHQINADCGIDENPDTERAVILLAFPLIKKECIEMLPLQSQLQSALKGTQPDLDYEKTIAAKMQLEEERNAAKKRQEERIRVMLGGRAVFGHMHDQNGDCMDNNSDGEIE